MWSLAVEFTRCHKISSGKETQNYLVYYLYFREGMKGCLFEIIHWFRTEQRYSERLSSVFQGKKFLDIRQTCVSYCLAVWPWECYLTFLSLSLFISESWIIITLHNSWEKWQMFLNVPGHVWYKINSSYNLYSFVIVVQSFQVYFLNPDLQV